METIYKTRVINHIKSLKYVLIGFSLVLLVFYFIASTEKVVISPAGFIIGLIPLLILIAPVVYLHISYYLENFALKIIIDESRGTLIVNKFGKEHAYDFSEIISVERHLAIYHKNRIDNLSRRVAPWTPYGYLLVKFKDGLQVYITSLLLDVSNPPILVTHTYFRFFPYIKSGIEFFKRRVIVDENYKNKISQFKSTFKHHSNQQLNEKIINRKTYDKAAVEAARQLLAIRSNMA